MRNWKLPLLAMAALTAFTLSATASNASLLVCEPDDFAAGTDMTNLCPQATLTVAGPDVGPVRSTTDSNPSTGTRVFSQNGDTGWNGENEILRADFDVLMKKVFIDIIPDDVSDPFFARIFGIGDTLLDEVTSPGTMGAGVVQTVSFFRASADIAYILASAVGSDSVQLDNLRYSVPEPGSLALLGLGLAGLGSMRRRKAA